MCSLLTYYMLQDNVLKTIQQHFKTTGMSAQEPLPLELPPPSALMNAQTSLMSGNYGNSPGLSPNTNSPPMPTANRLRIGSSSSSTSDKYGYNNPTCCMLLFCTCTVQ